MSQEKQPVLLRTAWEIEQDRLAAKGIAPMKWMNAVGAMLDDNGQYLVKTNGGEWRDADLLILPGFAVRKKMEPHIVRGRPLFVARITDPSQ